MIAVASIWELGWDTPLREHDLWRFLAAEFQIDGGIWLSPVSGIVSCEQCITERASLTDIFDELGVAGVFLDASGETALHDFEHPKSCVYVTGATSYPCTPHMREGDLSVRIQTPGAAGALWGHQAVCLALYDRQVKAWQQP